MTLSNQILTDTVLSKIRYERERQDNKWGEQNHDAGTWMLILQEELGEAAQAKLQGKRVEYVKELTEAASVLAAWIECEIRTAARE